ncbi:hypothetical protein K501DRAFT_282212 [Backusella circina FSU 941]|nr:hypothetical protein K501DRAFT_282212 [Backusella circina FSU 941]
MNTNDYNDSLTYSSQQYPADYSIYTAEQYQAEQAYFEEYDQEMAEAMYCEEEELQENLQEEEYIVDDSLLKLIVDVQSYLSEAPTDSPLLQLQYKMYTYFKQRVSEIEGEDATN